jgi:hypothetical protein
VSTAAPATTPTVARCDTGPATERIVALDAARKGLLVSPAVVAVAFVLGGAEAAASAAFALALVAANLLASAAALAWAAARSYGLVMGVALFGFLVRLAAVGAVVWSVRDLAWVHDAALGVTLVAGHLGLLAWEATSVSASLAFPALKPSKEPRP